MSNPDSDVLKERGNTLLKARDYEGAIRCYSEAMEFDTHNSKLLSNRCTAYLLLKNFDSALVDAKKCVLIDPDWYKAHVQVGSCYMGMKSYTDAITAYKKAISITDSKDSIQKLIDEAIEKESQHNIRYKLFGNSLKTMKSVGNILRVFILILTLLSFLPIISLRSKIITLFFVSYLCILIIHIYDTYGVPKFNTAYLRRLASDSVIQIIMPIIVFRKTSFLSFVMNIIVMQQLPTIIRFGKEVLEVVNTSLLKRCSDGIAAAISKVLPQENWATRTPAEKEFVITELFCLGSATLEIWLLPLSLLLLKRGLNGIIGVVMMYQYLLVRVSVSSYVSRAVSNVDMTINRLVYNPRCPLMIRNAYLWIREKIMGSYRGNQHS